MQDPLVTRVFTFSVQQHLFSPGATIVVALSGGPDSVSLFHILLQRAKELNLTLIVAHLDHGWRTDSAHDAQFCKALAEKYTCRFIQAHARDLFPEKKIIPSEESGRLLRRTFLQQVAAEYSADAIAFGQHKDDQIETFFIRLIRGASLSGLTGIQPKNALFIRPLLEISKQEILDYCARNNLSYCIDSTNTSDLYLRNRIRHTVIPSLTTIDKRFVSNCEKTIARLQKTEDYIVTQAENAFLRLSSLRDKKLYLSLPGLALLDPVLFPYLLIKWIKHEQVLFTPSDSLIEEIRSFICFSKRSKSHQVHPNWSFKKQKKEIFIERFRYVI